MNASRQPTERVVDGLVVVVGADHICAYAARLQLQDGLDTLRLRVLSDSGAHVRAGGYALAAEITRCLVLRFQRRRSPMEASWTSA